MIRRPIGLALVLGLLLAVSTIGIVLAQVGQLGGKFLTGNDITIPAGETIDHDLYVFAGSVTVNGTVNGDIVAAGGTIDLNGTVKGDVLVAGGRIGINGAINGDVRVAGGQITIAGDVTEDVLAAGGQATISSHVGQDLIVSGGQLTLTGTVMGGAVGTVGTYTKSGSVAGGDSITATGNQAVSPTPSNPVVDAIRHFIVVFVVAFLALWLARRAMGSAEAAVRERPVPSFGWGIGALIGYFVLVILVAIVAILLALLFAALGFGSLAGIDVFGAFLLIAGVTLAFVIVIAFVADAIVGVSLARLVAGRTRGPTTTVGRSAVGSDQWSELGMVAAGVAVVVVLTSIPIVGPLVKLCVVLLALGALWLVWRDSRMTARPIGPSESVPPAPPASGAG
jgi:hypothetical protein